MANCWFLLCFSFISLIASVRAFSSSAYLESKRSIRSPFAHLDQGTFNVQGFSSRFPSKFRTSLSGYSRKVVEGYERRRIDAELDINTAARAPAAAPGPASTSQAPKGANGTRNVAEEQKEKKKAKKKKERPAAVKWLVGIAVGSAAGVLSAVVASLSYGAIHGCVMRRRNKPMKPWVFQRKIIDAKALAFLEAAVATDSLELLGRGGSGAVYKASLENGRVVAVKKVYTCANSTEDGGHGGIEKDGGKSSELTKNSLQIKAELDTLGTIRHINLVTLLAYIPLPASHCLIYDYMENGSLHDALCKVQQGSLELPWGTRLKIAKEVATGLKYLHFECCPMIVHCDLKPGNILLDADMVAHIGDFGLAKLIPDSFTHYTSKNVAGTVGYIPPEYHQSCRYTTKGDVYGFGVVLVVLLTGKEPTDPFFADAYRGLGNWAVDVLQSGEENVRGVLDPHLHGHGDEAAMQLALKVACFCLSEDPAKRPTIGDVIVMLDQIRSPTQVQ